MFNKLPLASASGQFETKKASAEYQNLNNSLLLQLKAF